MNKEEIQEHLQKQLLLLKQEKAADYAFYQERMMNTSIQERVKNGVTWFPIQITRDFISTGDRLTLEIEKRRDLQEKHAFQVGVVVGIFTSTEEKDKLLSGVVSYLRENKMRVVLNQNDLPDWTHEYKLGINLLFDDNTYREMDKAIKSVAVAKNNRLEELRAILYGNEKAHFKKGQLYQLPELNRIQNRAFSKILDAKDVAFVHGPPGTGKTTTLVKCIREVIKEEKQVLVCAPSNAAVDLLVERLILEGVNTLRLGHPARLTPEVIENSLDVRMSKHPDFSRLKEMRKQSDEYRILASKYKRNFGWEERRQRDLLYRESKALKKESRELEDYITESMVDGAEVVACTLTGASHRLISNRLFKTVFIDEYSQAMEAAAWIPILKAHRVVMSGDHFQLPPTIKSLEAARNGLEHTLFAKGIENQADSVQMLEVQYRMEPGIMNFSSKMFYQNRLKADDSILDRQKLFEFPIAWVDTAGAGFEEKVKKETLSTYNDQEAVLIVKLLQEETLEELSIGVIAPYRAQTEILHRAIQYAVQLGKHSDRIDVNSVDAFQGQERDVVYISLVRSNSNGEIGFLKEYRRMNVAMTRAKHRLVIVGDSSTVGQDRFFGDLLDHVQKHGKYQSVYELDYFHEL